MSDKFGRSYRVTIDPKDGGPLIVIVMPLTIQFTMNRSVMSSLNTLDIDIYNLAEQNRNRIFQDWYTATNRTITLEGGYDTLSLIYSGNIYQASTAREGTNLITRITAKSGSFDVEQTNVFTTLEKGKTLGDIFKYLIGNFPNLKLGAVGDYPDVLHRPVALNGNNYNLLKKYSANQVFIDNDKVFVLNNNETIAGELTEISTETGLLETPRRDEGSLVVTTIFEPRVKISQLIDLKSSVLPVYNGQYRVNGIMHQGIISGAVGGRCISQFNLFTGNQSFKTVSP